MKKLSAEAEKIMIERFGKDTVIALATSENEVPHVRYVNAYYENGAFYIITHARSKHNTSYLKLKIIYKNVNRVLTKQLCYVTFNITKFYMINIL